MRKNHHQIRVPAVPVASALHFTREQIFLSYALVFLIIILIAPRLTTIRSIRSLIRNIGFKKRRGIRIAKQFLSDDARLRHTHIVGSTGSGKSVLLKQIIFEDIKRGYGAIVIDPKGDRELYEEIRDFCRENGRSGDLNYLSATFRDESVRWNPCALGNSSELQSKFYNSTIFSEPHYAKSCELGMVLAFNSLIETQGLGGFTLLNLAARLKDLNSDLKLSAIEGLFLDIRNLTESEWKEILIPEKDTRNAISVLDIVTNNKILFIDLPTESKKVQSARIGRLITQEIMLVSGMRKIHPELKGTKPFSVFIDEFDAFASESFATFQNKGRSSDFMLHLAHTTFSDLNDVGPNFRGKILGNCNVRFNFRLDDPEDAELAARLSGTRLSVKQTYQTDNGAMTGLSSNREAYEFLFAPDEIKNLRIGECIFTVKSDGVNKKIKVPFKKAAAPERSPIPLVPVAIASKAEKKESFDEWSMIPAHSSESKNEVRSESCVS